jgi:acyl carrier protein
MEALAVAAFEAPRGETEEAIAAIWQDLLGIERVGRHDNFFEIGANSLILIQAKMRIEASFDIAFPLSLMFDAPTLDSFCEKFSAVMEDQKLARARKAEELRNYVEGLSEEEAERLIGEYEGISDDAE